MSATATETTQQLPQMTVFTRVASIPLILSSLEALDQTLSSNAYTRSVYPTAKGLSSTAYKYTEPIQMRLAPLLARADSYANKAVDAVEARYPYPFKAKPEEVTEYVRERRQSVSESFQHSIDENVKSPALHAATEIDQRFAPLVDYIEVAVNRIMNPNEPGPSAPDAKYQYQRALALTRNLYGYSNDQLRQLQAHSALLQRATETAHSISAQAASSLANAQSRVHQLSDTMLVELQKLQASTAAISASFQTSATSAVQSRIPSHVQEAFSDLSHTLSAAASDLSSTITAKDVPLQEKVGKIASEVRERIVPLLGSVTKAVSDALHPKSDPTAPSSDEVVNDQPQESKQESRDDQQADKADSAK